jgi:hypothetical protein
MNFFFINKWDQMLLQFLTIKKYFFNQIFFTKIDIYNLKQCDEISYC